MRAEGERGIETAEIVQLRDKLEERMRHVETVHARLAGVLELSGEHVLAIVRIRPAVERLFGALIKTRDAARGVEKFQRHGETVGVTVGVGGVQEARGVMIIKEGDELILCVRIVVGSEGVVVVFNLFRVAAPLEYILRGEEQRVVEQ